MNTAEILSQYGINPSNTGSVEAECAILTAKINALTIHLKSNKKDFQTRRGLIAMVTQRKRRLSYLKRKDAERYEELMRKLHLDK